MNPILKFNFKTWARSPGPFYVFGFSTILFIVFGQFFLVTSFLPNIIIFMTVEIAIFSFGASFSDLRNSVIIKRIGAIKYSKSYFLVSQIVFASLVTLIGIAWLAIMGIGGVYLTQNTNFHIIPQQMIYNVNYSVYSVPENMSMILGVGQPVTNTLGDITVTLGSNSNVMLDIDLNDGINPIQITGPTEFIWHAGESIVSVDDGLNQTNFGGGTTFEYGNHFELINDLSRASNIKWIWLIYGLAISTILSISYAFLVVSLTKTTEQYNIWSQIIFLIVGLLGGIFIGNQALIYSWPTVYQLSFLIPHTYILEFIRAAMVGISPFDMPEGVGYMTFESVEIATYDPTQVYLMHSMALDLAMPIIFLALLTYASLKKFKWSP